MTANDPKTVVSIIRGGAGIGVVPRFLAQPRLEDGSMEIVLPQYRPPEAEMCIVHHSPGRVNPRADLFATFMQAEMRGHTLPGPR